MDSVDISSRSQNNQLMRKDFSRIIILGNRFEKQWLLIECRRGLGVCHPEA